MLGRSRLGNIGVQFASAAESFQQNAPEIEGKPMFCF